MTTLQTSSLRAFVQGTIKVGDELVVTKISCLSKTPVKPSLYPFMLMKREVQEASEKMVKVKVKDGNKLGIYKGTMLHSETVTDTQVYHAYRFTMDIAFVRQQDGILTERIVKISRFRHFGDLEFILEGPS